MHSGQYEEVKMGRDLYYVTYTSILDPAAFEEKCPRCGGKERASRLIFEIEEVLKGEQRETVELNGEMMAKVERAVRRHLVKQGEMVTLTLDCLWCRSDGEVRKDIRKLEREH